LDIINQESKTGVDTSKQLGKVGGKPWKKITVLNTGKKKGDKRHKG